MATGKRSDDSGSDGRSASITRRPFLRSLAGAGALGIPAFSTSAFAKPPGHRLAEDPGVAIDYKNCGVATVMGASDAESLSIYYADADGERQLRSVVDPTTGDQHQYRPIIVEHSSGSDKTKIQLTGSGGPLVHIVADLYSGGRTACTNPSGVCVPEGFNSPPTVSITAETDDTDPTSGSIEVDVGEEVKFRSDAKDPDDPHERLRYEWNLDGTGFVESLGDVATHAYENAGSYTVQHRVTDDFGEESNVAKLTLTVDRGFDWSLVHTFVPDGLAPSDGFGNSVATSGETAIVGAPHDDEVGDNCGAAYAYDLGRGSPSGTKLVPDDPGWMDMFGSSVSVSSDTVVIGAPIADGTGAAYVYDVGGSSPTWTMPLGPEELDRGDLFGTSVAVSGERVIVGARLHDDKAGAAYVYDVSGSSPTWTKLLHDGLDESNQFGASVAVSDGTAVVGAPAPDGTGAAYVYDVRGDSPTLTGRVPADPAYGDRFGASVSVSGGTAVVGAPGAEVGGAAYVYDVSESSPTLTEDIPAETAGNDRFGASVAVSGRTAVVGAPGVDGKGAAYAYDLSENPLEPKTLVPATLADGDEFGHSVSVSDRTLVVGAPYDDGEGDNAGAAYVYKG